MALFQQSDLPWVSAVQEIADSAGASANHEMRVRAHRSLRASFQYLNSRTTWEYLFAHAAPIQITGPFYPPMSATAGAGSAEVGAGHGIEPDDLIGGPGLILGARVTATATTAVGFNVTLTGIGAGSAFTASASRDLYSLPSDFKKPYTVHMLGTQRSIRFRRPRTFDRLISDTRQASTVYEYDVSRIAGKGKLRLLFVPNGADVLDVQYYRRMYLGTATGDTTPLDIPQDFEWTPIAFAKWHFLTDKKENEQAGSWFSLSERGIESMLRDNVRQPDEDLRFQPGHVRGGYSDNDTRVIPWES